MTSPPTAARRGLSGAQKGFLGVFAIALVASVAWRAWGAAANDGSGASGAGSHAASFVGGTRTEPARAPQGIERYLPYVTEGSLFGIIGFALGYASRKFLKVGLIAIALVFVGIQLLVSTGHVAVDWLGVNSKLNEWIFNIQQNETLTSFLTNRVPSAGALLAGYVFGFRRG